MADQDWRKRLLESTRGRVLSRLRRSEHTVNELAAVLGLTDNGVRLHLDALQRDGLVEQRGVRREGVGKPAYVYGTTPSAETIFPKAYEPVLNELLRVLETTHSPDELSISYARPAAAWRLPPATVAICVIEWSTRRRC